MAGSRTQAPKVTVFIPTLNRDATIGACLEALAQQTCRDFEVLIVDGGSTDETRHIVDSYRNRLTIRWTEQGGGLIAAANVGWKQASGEIFTRTDDDAVPSPTWIASIIRAFDADPTIGGVTGPTIIPAALLEERDLTLFNSRMQQARHPFWRIFAKIYYCYFMEGQPFAVSRFFRSGAFSLGSNYEACLCLPGRQAADHLEACNWSVRRSLLERVGGFDPAFTGIGEYHEPDVAYKIRALGYHLVFDPAVRVEHRPSVVGVYKARPNTYSRSMNFVLFYLRHIKLNSLDKLCRFSSYLAVVNAYWIYKAIVTRDAHALGGLAGSIVGLYRYRRAGSSGGSYEQLPTARL